MSYLLISRYLSFWLLFFVMSCQTLPKQPADVQRGTLVDNGMVSSAHPLASKVGVQILQAGGNATDAAVATFFALAVVYPRAGNIGGGGFALCRWADGSTNTLDFRETAPNAAHRDMYLDEKGEVIPRASLDGYLAVGVPAAVDGMWELHKKNGKLSWQTVLAPAIELAQNGFALTTAEAEYLNKYREDFIKQNKTLPTHIVKANEWQKGEKIYHKDLAKTLQRISEKGRDEFYKGETAQLLLAEMKAGGGIITAKDLENYRSIWRKAVTGNYKNYKVITMPPPSSGGIALLQLLHATEKYPIRKWGHNTARTMHAMIEIERRVYADRATHLGDPDFYKVPQEMLLNKNYLKKRMADILMNEKTPSEKIKEGKVERIESVETTHLSVVDKDRNAIAITTTLNGNYGSKVMVNGAGFFLNNEMDDFSVKVGHPNQFGLVGGEANAIMPNKRMLSSMTPTILEQNGKLLMVVGTPGGSTIITSNYQTILNVLEHQMTMQEAVDAKKFHHQWLPDEVLLEENAFDDKVKTELQQLGHRLEPIPSLGRMDCILVLPNGKLEGGADKRGDNMAVGY